MSSYDFDPTDADSILHAAVTALHDEGLIVSVESLGSGSRDDHAWSLYQVRGDAVRVSASTYEAGEAAPDADAGWELQVQFEGSGKPFANGTVHGETFDDFLTEARRRLA